MRESLKETNNDIYLKRPNIIRSYSNVRATIFTPKTLHTLSNINLSIFFEHSIKLLKINII